MQTVIRTVMGDIDATEVGPTLMHEHCSVDVGRHLETPSDPDLARFIDAKVEMNLLSLLRRHPLDVCRDNTKLDDPYLILDELAEFASRGGSCVVECTVIGMGRRPDVLRWLSESAGLHLVAGTGLYVDSFHPDWVTTDGIDDIAARFVADIEHGIDGTDVRAGLIGEIGTSGTARGAAKSEKQGAFTPNEEKSLRAAARAAIATGACVSLHIDRRAHGGGSVVDVLESEGLPPSRIIAGHLDICEDISYDIGLAERGVYVQYDGFGREYYADNVGVSFPKDTERIRRLKEMIDRGFGPQLLISQDVTLKIDLLHYGGVGYGHVLGVIVPLLREIGVDDNTIETILIHNPRRALALATPTERGAV